MYDSDELHNSETVLDANIDNEDKTNDNAEALA